MEFFFVTETSGFKFTDKSGFTLEVVLRALDKKSIQNNKIQPDKLYFTTDILLPVLIDMAKKNNKENILNFFKGRENVYPQFLAQKDIWNNRNEGFRKLPDKQLKIALVFDINPHFDPDFSNNLVANLNYFSEKLENHFQNVEIDVFTILLWEWVDLLDQVSVTNLHLLPAPIDKLASYDAFINFSDIVNDNNLIDKSALDICLKTLGVNAGNGSKPFRTTTINDLVSIIMPTYNRAHFIAEAVESVLNQTYKNIELIIVDDGSTDNTAAIVEKYLTDKRIKYFYQQNKGVCSARNNGILKAQGKYLMFLDDDDIFLPYTVHKLLTFIKKQAENVKLVFGDLIYFHPENKIFRREMKIIPKPELFSAYVTGNAFSTIGLVLAETQAVKDIGMFDETYLYSEDYELISKMVFKYDFAKIDVPVNLYRKHDNQATKNRGTIRYFSDKISLKFWYMLRANNIQPFILRKQNNLSENEIIAARFDVLAGEAFNCYVAHYDTTLELLKFAQEMAYDKDRQNYINYLSENIPKLIREEYNSDLRISEAEKETLKQQLISQRF